MHRGVDARRAKPIHIIPPHTPGRLTAKVKVAATLDSQTLGQVDRLPARGTPVGPDREHAGEGQPELPDGLPEEMPGVDVQSCGTPGRGTSRRAPRRSSPTERLATGSRSSTRRSAGTPHRRSRRCPWPDRARTSQVRCCESQMTVPSGITAFLGITTMPSRM
jgi:hypothetical protein